VQAATTNFVNSDLSGSRLTPTHLSTLVYAFVNSRIDCSCWFTKDINGQLQHVLNAAVHVVTGTWKFDCSLGQILHDELHWLDIPDRVFFNPLAAKPPCGYSQRPVLHPMQYVHVVVVVVIVIVVVVVVVIVSS